MAYKKNRIKFARLLIKIKYTNWPFSTKVLGIFVFFLCILFSVLAFSYQFYLNDKYASIIQLMQNNSMQAAIKIDQFIYDAQNVTKIPMSQLQPKSKFMEGLNRFKQNSQTDSEFETSCEAMFNNMLSYKTDFHSVFLFNTSGKSVYKIKNTDLYEEFVPLKEQWFKAALEENGLPVIADTFKMPFLMINKPIYVFSVARAVIDVRTDQPLGVVMLNCSTSFFDRLTESMITSEGQRIIVANQSGYVIYDTQFDALSEPASVLSLVKLAKEPGKNIVAINGADFVVSHSISRATDWNIINLIPAKEFNRQLHKLSSTLMVIFTAIFIATSCILLYSVKKMLKPLHRLTSLAKIAQRGEFSINVGKVKSHDEIGTLSRAFNTMLGNIHQLINTVYKNELKQKQLELDFLKSQINPHFLYNALETIHMKAEIEDQDEIAKMTLALGKFLRLATGSRNDFLTVKEELDYLDQYLLIHKVRYGSRLRISVEVEEQLLSFVIIKLILQPIVENAINYGFGEGIKSLDILIKGYVAGQTLVFEISDNGIGIIEEKVEKLNAYINEENSFYKGIGLRNVNRRVKGYYGDEFGITVLSRFGEGTLVRVSMPYNSYRNEMVSDK